MPEVFISYARADRKHVRLIALALQKEGFSVWWDPEIKPGKKWNDAIRKALSRADCVVTCWSPASAKSDWVAAESHHAYATGGFVPVMLKPCVPPLPFNVIQASDLTAWRGDPDDAEWVAALERVRAAIEGKRRPPVAAPTAEEAQAAVRAAAIGAASVGATAQAEPPPAEYALSKTRGRMKPRASRFVLAAVVVGVVITGGLWAADAAAPGLLATWAHRLAPQIFPAPPAPAESAPFTVDPIQEAALPTPPAAPPALTLLEELPPDVAPAPIAPAPDPATPPRRPGANPGASLGGQLEACATRLAFACPAAAGRAPLGFRGNGVVDPAERRFLATLGVALDPADSGSVRTCEAALQASAPSPALRSACGTLIYPTTPAPPTQVTATPPATATPTRDPAGAQPAAPTRGVGEQLVEGMIRQLPGLLAQREQTREQTRDPAQSQPQQAQPSRQSAPTATTPPQTQTQSAAQQLATRTPLPGLPSVQLSIAGIDAQLDRCLNQLARYCSPPATGFAADGRISTAERALLSSTQLFQSPGALTRENLQTCEAHVQAAARPATTGATRTYLPLAAACSTLPGNVIVR
ncbi:MAG: toll/interleukin-1 receptor domain-containing protein [Hyphomonadaceae bacterium]|nr:toll/interleukin-1 receptor domain-containing protein [Hyphomonadaceae bacterium]